MKLRQIFFIIISLTVCLFGSGSIGFAQMPFIPQAMPGAGVSQPAVVQPTTPQTVQTGQQAPVQAPQTQISPTQPLPVDQGSHHNPYFNNSRHSRLMPYNILRRLSEPLLKALCRKRQVHSHPKLSRP